MPSSKPPKRSKPEQEVVDYVYHILTDKLDYKPQDIVKEFKIMIGSEKRRLDIAIFHAKKPHYQSNILAIVECKAVSVDNLKRATDQLYSYLSATRSAQFGILAAATWQYFEIDSNEVFQSITEKMNLVQPWKTTDYNPLKTITDKIEDVTLSVEQISIPPLIQTTLQSIDTNQVTTQTQASRSESQLELALPQPPIPQPSVSHPETQISHQQSAAPQPKVIRPETHVTHLQPPTAQPKVIRRQSPFDYEIDSFAQKNHNKRRAKVLAGAFIFLSIIAYSQMNSLSQSFQELLFISASEGESLNLTATSIMRELNPLSAEMNSTLVLSTQIPASSPTLWMEFPARVRVNGGQRANVRAEPTITALIIDTVPNGSEIRILIEHESQDWLYVRLPNNNVGWISASLVIPIP
jgi:hypothetical protein